MTKVFLSTGGGTQTHKALMRLSTNAKPPAVYLSTESTSREAPCLSYSDSRPAILVSFSYYAGFTAMRSGMCFRCWMLDSGAFTAHASGKSIDLREYTELCLSLKDDPLLKEIVALDVIGDYRQTLKNVEYMWSAGVPAIPTYHEGEPWDYLLHIAKRYPKIALGGVAHAKGAAKLAWAAQCFARVWPKRIHGFGFGAEKALMTLPFHSADASSWGAGPLYGRYSAMPGLVVARGSSQNMRIEVEKYLRLERLLQRRWAKEMEQLRCLEP